MHSILFRIGPITAYSYGFMIAVGVIIAFFISSRRAVKYGLNGDEMFNMGLIGLAAGLLGAKLLYLIVELPAILENPSILKNVTDGFVVYGGLIGGFSAPVLYARKKKLPFWKYLDIAVAGVAAAQGCGRIGCFLAGCCYGRQTAHWFSVTFPEGSLAPAGIPLIPTQLLSSAGDFLLAAALVLLRRRFPEERAATSFYLMLYSAGRFTLEFFRGDPRGGAGVFSTSQLIALFTFAAGVVLFAASRRGQAEKG